MTKCNLRFYNRAIMAGNAFILWSSIVVLGLSVGALTYDVDSWLPFDYKPVLETHKVATASLIISAFCLHLASLGWLALGFRRQWQIKAYMIGNMVASLLQLAIGIGVLVVQKRAWPYFQLISLHLCFERFNRQRSRRVVRSLDVNATAEEETSLEGWFPTGTPSEPVNRKPEFQDSEFFNSFGALPTRPGPAVPSECLPTDLLTAVGSLLIIAAVISAFLVFCSFRLWRHHRDDSIHEKRRNTFSIETENPQEIPPMLSRHPEKPPRFEPKTQENDDKSNEL